MVVEYHKTNPILRLNSLYHTKLYFNQNNKFHNLDKSETFRKIADFTIENYNIIILIS